MTRERIREIVIQALAARAPGTDPGALRGDEDLRDALDLDSIDFLGFVTKLQQDTGVTVPESEYRNVATLDGCVAFLEQRVGER